jgi:hypothetical protein
MARGVRTLPDPVISGKSRSVPGFAHSPCAGIRGIFLPRTPAVTRHGSAIGDAASHGVVGFFGAARPTMCRPSFCRNIVWDLAHPPLFKKSLKHQGFGPEPIRRHRLACGYGPRRPSTLAPHSIEAIEMRDSETAGSPPPARALIKTGGGQECGTN